jgi:microcystin-dependent protein
VSSPFVAEIRMFGFQFAPTGWAFCAGQLLPISQNTALFSLLGTTYGGDGKSTFALPDMQGNVPMHQGQGPGLADRFLGEIGGSETVTLLQSEMPLHSHTMSVSSGVGLENNPSGQKFAEGDGVKMYAPTAANPVMMSPFALTPAGASLPHNNMQPYLTINFCIALQGVFPARN